MKLLAYLLLVIAICGGVVVAAVWRHQVKDFKIARCLQERCTGQFGCMAAGELTQRSVRTYEGFKR